MNRTMVHIALNAKNERVGCLVATCGKFIPFTHYADDLIDMKHRKINYWMNADWGMFDSVKEWKRFKRQASRAVRFQRVMLVA